MERGRETDGMEANWAGAVVETGRTRAEREKGKGEGPAYGAESEIPQGLTPRSTMGTGML